MRNLLKLILRVMKGSPLASSIVVGWWIIQLAGLYVVYAEFGLAIVVVVVLSWNIVILLLNNYMKRFDKLIENLFKRELL